jgi:hypothetical protein
MILVSVVSLMRPNEIRRGKDDYAGGQQEQTDDHPNR